MLAAIESRAYDAPEEGRIAESPSRAIESWHRQYTGVDIHRARAADERSVAAGDETHLPVGARRADARDDIE